MSEKINHITGLPKRLVNELYQIAKEYGQKGVRLFIFGSFANATNRSTSDLDIGILWSDKRSQRTFRCLYKDIQNLPTIRKIDLVDMEETSEAFKNNVLSQNILLLDDSHSPKTNTPHEPHG